MPNIQIVKKSYCGKNGNFEIFCGKLGGKCEKTHPIQGLHFLSFDKRNKFSTTFSTSSHNCSLKRGYSVMLPKNGDKCNVGSEARTKNE